MANINDNYLLRNYLSSNNNGNITDNELEEIERFGLADSFDKLTAEDRLLDINWVRSRYGISDKELLAYDIKEGRYFSTASYKYTNTSLGGHISINPKPMYTPYCDVPPEYNAARRTEPLRVIGSQKGKTTQTDFSMGRYYSEAIDDNAKLVYFTFGTKRFNGLLDYFFSAVDYGDSIVANTGRKPRFYQLGYTVGSFAVFACFPITTLLIWGIKLVSNLLNMNKSFDYYYMEPSMHTYWSSVNNIATQIAVELGLINPKMEKSLSKRAKEDTHSLGMGAKLEQEEIEQIAKVLGKDMFNPDTHYLDIYAVVLKPQLRYLEYTKRHRDRLEQYDPNSAQELSPLLDEEGGLVTVPSGKQADFNIDDIPSEYNSFKSYLKDYIHTNKAWTPEDDDKIPVFAGQLEEELAKIGQAGEDKVKAEDEKKRSHDEYGFRHEFHDYKNKDSFFNKMQAAMNSAIHDGAQSAIFQVEYMGAVSETFSNDTGEIQTGSMLKAAANGMRDMKFNLAGGNIGMGFNLGDVIGAVKDFAVGGLNGITFGLGNVISTLLGDQYIDMPKIWTDSSVTLPGASFTIKLRTPYGNVFSRYRNIWLPLSMLLAGALPLSAGPRAYTSPFLCSMNAQGINNIKMGMITSLTITRGTSNLPFTRSSSPLGIDVNFTVTDFSNIITAPISSGIFGDTFLFGYDDEGPFGRYIATIAGRDIQTFKYYRNRLGRRLARIAANIESASSPYRWGGAVGNAVLAPTSLFVEQGNFLVGLPGMDQR